MDYRKLRRQLRRHEGSSPVAYKDTTGHWTIGVGRNISTKGLSEEEIDHLLDNDINECVEDLKSRYPWWVEVDDARQRALLDLRFNLGAQGFSKFTQTLAACERGDWWGAAIQFRMNHRYFEQVGKRAERIARMLETGRDE